MFVQYIVLVVLKKVYLFKRLWVYRAEWLDEGRPLGDDGWTGFNPCNPLIRDNPRFRQWGWAETNRELLTFFQNQFSDWCV